MNTRQRLIGIVAFVMITAIASIVGAWHGKTSPSADCTGWKVGVDTNWEGHIGAILSSSNLEGTWTDTMKSADWAVTIGWLTGETWSDSDTISRPSNCDQPPPPECEEGEIEINGVCYPPPPPECEEGEVEIDGECQPPPPPPPCEKECVPYDPQSVTCIVPLAAAITSITHDGSSVSFTQTAWDHIEFDDGDLMASQPILDVSLENGEQIKLKVTPGIDYSVEGYTANACYIAESTGWEPGRVPPSGSVNFARKQEITPCPE